MQSTAIVDSSIVRENIKLVQENKRLKALLAEADKKNAMQHEALRKYRADAAERYSGQIEDNHKLRNALDFALLIGGLLLLIGAGALVIKALFYGIDSLFFWAWGLNV